MPCPRCGRPDDLIFEHIDDDRDSYLLLRPVEGGMVEVTIGNPAMWDHHPEGYHVLSQELVMELYDHLTNWLNMAKRAAIYPADQEYVPDRVIITPVYCEEEP